MLAPHAFGASISDTVHWQPACILKRRNVRMLVRFQSGAIHNEAWVHTACLRPALLSGQVLAPYAQWTESKAKLFCANLSHLIRPSQLQRWLERTVQGKQCNPHLAAHLHAIVQEVKRQEQPHSKASGGRTGCSRTDTKKKRSGKKKRRA